MAYPKLFFMTFAIFIFLWSVFAGEEVSKQTRLQQIDAQIEELQGMKRGFEARALKHENQAEWLQFDDKTYLETRRHLQLADENRAKAAAVQKEIDRLEEERAKLVKKR